jgi:hypothetical protein
MSPRRNWDSPNPSLASVWSAPPRTGGRHTRLRVRGWGSSNSDDWRKSFPLCLLCGTDLLARGRAVQREVSVEAEPQPLCCPIHGQSYRFSKIQNIPNDPATTISLHQIIFVFEINTLHTYELLSKMAWVWLATCTLA